MAVCVTGTPQNFIDTVFPFKRGRDTLKDMIKKESKSQQSLSIPIHDVRGNLRTILVFESDTLKALFVRRILEASIEVSTAVNILAPSDKTERETLKTGQLYMR